MPDTNLTAAQESEASAPSYAGTLKISVVSSIGLIPVENATVTISYTGDPGSPLKVLNTDSNRTPRTSPGSVPPAGKRTAALFRI